VRGRVPGPGNPPPRSPSPLVAEPVELAVPDPAEKGVPLVGREAEHCPPNVPTVPNADLVAGKAGHLDAVTVSVTQRAFHPFVLTFERRHDHATPH
jgi:hypothetical protein